MKPYWESADGRIVIYHGDCRDVLPLLAPQSVDLLLTDPPYGMAFGGFRGVDQNVSADGARQGIRLVRQALHEGRDVMTAEGHFLIFCHWESWPDFYDACSPFFAVKNALIWHKDRGGMGDVEMEYARDYEVVLYGVRGRRAIDGKRDGAVITGIPPVPSRERLHPTQKPRDLLAYLIAKHCPPTGTVLDPFMGSGTTLRAAMDLGRRAVGIELSRDYCDIAVERMRQGVLL